MGSRVAAEGFSLPRDVALVPMGSGSAAPLVVDTTGAKDAGGVPAALLGPSLDRGPNNSASCGRVRVLDLSTGEVVGLPCKSWRCDSCSVTNARAFSKRLRLGLSESAVSDRERPKLLTLTSRPGEAAWVSRRLLGRRFAELRRHLQRAFPGVTINYAGSVELTRAGSIHLHVVLRGVPFLPQAVWSRLAARVGLGYIVDVRAVKSAEGMAGYLTKQLGSYLTKQAGSLGWPPHFRRIRFSQAWAEGWEPRRRRCRQPEDQSTWVFMGISATPVLVLRVGVRGALAGQGPP